jgi:hypothetical protein
VLLKDAPLICVVLALSIASATPRVAGAADAKACAVAANDASTLRSQAKLKDARARALRCAEAECPVVVQRECVRLVDELNAEIPSFVPSASAEGGGDLVDVEVTVDGEQVAERLDGRAIEVDPGPHALRFTRGAQSVETSAVLRVGEKRRVLAVVFPRVSAGSDARAATADTPNVPHARDDATEHSPATRGASAWPWVLGGAGLVVASGGALLQIDTAAQARELRGTCAPNCDEGDVDALRTRYWISAGFYAVAAVALGGAVYLRLREHRAVRVAPNALGVRVDVTF